MYHGQFSFQLGDLDLWDFVDDLCLNGHGVTDLVDNPGHDGQDLSQVLDDLSRDGQGVLDFVDNLGLDGQGLPDFVNDLGNDGWGVLDYIDNLGHDGQGVPDRVRQQRATTKHRVSSISHWWPRDIPGSQET